MDVVEHLHESQKVPQRRKSARYEVQCRARIVIARRHYAGYIHDISQGGARLRTITPIRRLGEVLLRLPDLPPIRCQLRWTDSYNAGVEFEPALPRLLLSRWAATRSAVVPPSCLDECEISEVEDLANHPQLIQSVGAEVRSAA